jgi:hypothetical protein
MWNQTIFSKKNRNLHTGGQLMDGYHILTSGDQKARSSDILADLRLRAKQHTPSTISFINKTKNGLFVGLIGKVGDVIGGEHEFAREAPDGRYSGVGRKIAFNHAYDCSPSAALKIPDLAELGERQRASLLHVLTEAHAGREPVSLEPVIFETKRAAGTDWDLIAAEVEAGRCQGGFFTPEGKLLERFESIAETVKNAAQKKTPLEMPRQPITSGEIAHAKGMPFIKIAAVTIGVTMTGWAAWELIKRNRNRSSEERSMK